MEGEGERGTREEEEEEDEGGRRRTEEGRLERILPPTDRPGLGCTRHRLTLIRARDAAATVHLHTSGP